MFPEPQTCTVHINNMAVIAHVGVYHHEFGRLQELIVSVDIEAVFPPADAVAHALDYKLVADLANDLGQSHIGLIEIFAFRLASRILEHPLAVQVQVRVDKPRALVAAMAGATVALARPQSLK